MKISSYVPSLVVSSVLLAACSSSSSTSGTDTADSSGSEGGTASTSGGSAESGDVTSSSASGSQSGSSGGSAESASGTTAGTSETGAGFIGTESGGVTPQPNGSSCLSDEECESMKCYTIPGRDGVCSDCTADADCQTGGGPGSCGFTIATGYATCTDGSRGSACESGDSCADGLFCEPLIGSGFTYCSDCSTDDDCMAEQICTPYLNDGEIGGYKYCIDPGDVPNDQLCPIVDMAGRDEACASGHCYALMLMSGTQLGICGECGGDEDCGEGMSCQAPEFRFTMRTGSLCVEGTGTGTGGSDGGTTGAGETGGATTGTTGTTG